LSRPGGRFLSFLRLGSFLVLGGLAGVEFALGQVRPFWLVPALLAGIFAFFGILASPRFWGWLKVIRSLIVHPAFQGCLLLIGSPALGLWLADQVDPLEPEENFNEIAATLPPSELLQEAPRDSATTDAGSPIRVWILGSVKETDAALVSISEDGILDRPGIHEHFIRTGNADDRYNCHGWVFTNGLYWIKGEQVEQIIKENGYQQVSEPRENDLAIFRSEKGAIVHSGLVRALTRGGLVLIESKWGRAGRFLHSPDFNLYGGTCTFYHSSRPGHCLHGLTDSGFNVISRQG
jgi:hypothetical protein